LPRVNRKPGHPARIPPSGGEIKALCPLNRGFLFKKTAQELFGDTTTHLFRGTKDPEKTVPDAGQAEKEDISSSQRC
jgi:hypothetical protein